MPLIKPTPEQLEAQDLTVNLVSRHLMDGSEIRQMNLALHIAQALNEKDGGVIDALSALAFHGPLFDGDVPSKSARDELLDHGLAVRTMVAGEDGYTAITYAGRDVFTCLYSPDPASPSLREAVANCRNKRKA